MLLRKIAQKDPVYELDQIKKNLNKKNKELEEKIKAGTVTSEDVDAWINDTKKEIEKIKNATSSYREEIKLPKTPALSKIINNWKEPTSNKEILFPYASWGISPDKKTEKSTKITAPDAHSSSFWKKHRNSILLGLGIGSAIGYLKYKEAKRRQKENQAR